MSKAIITCLSACKRGEPITSTRPYALLPLLNKELVRHQLESLLGTVDEVVLVVNEKSAAGAEKIKGNHGTINITIINNSTKELVLRALQDAAFLIPSDLLLLRKPVPAGKTVLLVTNEGSEEEDACRALLDELAVELAEEVVEARRVNYPWELLTANQALCKTVTERKIDSSVRMEQNVVITGPVIIGKDTVIKANSYLEGPIVIGEGCEIGPFAHIRPETSIGDGCRIGKTEVVDCVLLHNVTSKHTAYLGHSVIGAEVNIGAFTVTADYRHDGKNHHSFAYDGDELVKIDTQRRKVGAFLGDKVHTGISTLLYPGRKLWPATTTLPGEVVKEDKRS